MFEWLKTWQHKRQLQRGARDILRQAEERALEVTAATQLPPPPDPKVKPKQQTVPSYFRTATPNTQSALPRTDRALVNKNLNDYRSGADSRAVVRDFARSTPDLSAAVFAYIRIAITDSYTAVARNLDGSFSPEGTALAQQMLARFDVLPDYSDGFSGISSMRSNSEMLLQELLYYGAMSLELVLGKDRLPRALQPVSVTEIDMYADSTLKGLAPRQRKSGLTIDLDIPTFFYAAIDQDLLEPYAESPLQAAIQPTVASTEFMNDLRRVIKRVVHPRMIVTINEDKFRENCPQEISQDQEKLKAYMDSVISDVQTMVNGLNPEDALVVFDTVGIELLNNGNITLNKEYEVLQGVMDAKMATGMKTLPSILGHGSGSQNVASTETMLFMKSATGLQAKLNEIYSRALTLAVRLFGVDCTVEFKYQPIDLRPDAELEQFKLTKQDRILELLSIGYMTDEQACLALTGGLPPAGAPKLQGTMFYQAKGATGGNPFSNTAGERGNGAGGTVQQSTGSGAPAQPRGAPRRAA